MGVGRRGAGILVVVEGGDVGVWQAAVRVLTWAPPFPASAFLPPRFRGRGRWPLRARRRCGRRPRGGGVVVVDVALAFLSSRAVTWRSCRYLAYAVSEQGGCSRRGTYRGSPGGVGGTWAVSVARWAWLAALTLGPLLPVPVPCCRCRVWFSTWWSWWLSCGRPVAVVLRRRGRASWFPVVVRVRGLSRVVPWVVGRGPGSWWSCAVS